jgi:hypothetical protein
VYSPSSLFLILGLLLASSSAAFGQVRMHGRVIDDATLEPVAGARVLLLDGTDRVLGARATDESGLFEFQLRFPTTVRMQASRVGYERNTTPWIDLRGYSMFRMEIRLAADAVLLAPLEVVARAAAGSPVLAGFHDRRVAGIGWFFTRDEIERIRPTRVSDLVMRVPGIRVETSGTGTVRHLYSTRTSCPVQIYVDGFHINRNATAAMSLSIDESVLPQSVEAVEVYSGLSTVPAEFLSPQATCGVVAVWTRRNSRESR